MQLSLTRRATVVGFVASLLLAVPTARGAVTIGANLDRPASARITCAALPLPIRNREAQGLRCS